MSPKKLSDSDKKDILELYRQPDETTSTLANRYQVSSSTISRFLKNNLSDSEYEVLIQQKRLSRTPGRTQVPSQEMSQQPVEDQSDAGSQRRRRRRPSAPSKPATESESPSPTPSDQTTPATQQAESYGTDEESADEAEFTVIQEMLGEDLGELEENEEDREYSDEGKGEEQVEDKTDQGKSETADIQVLSLSEAKFPKPCYLVVDRAAELITRPLKEFSDLGKIPGVEIQQKTLPVFDNHKVARRFSNRYQRVIKVPDGQILGKTCAYLEAKGISRLLIDGQVYSLSSL
ncbi:MAG: transposase [Cyanobacteria bacterium QS_7_48_42]|nr:MAG: transposase [Cyanobacteria bacterium QS_9_48_30]PSO97057.1 MAG: transposase [Cyanobacteria bacterium SW_6_48_11]PSO99592.1 MAG: transposase [Cyanobacteria bacterium QS_7_48_42]PSP13990.1 MAG: transposase [Cyanobacteria bacterium SW_10_48_33]PSP14737.1 MAG: transposase [Cyanobacteria bacterium SW_11_48_12]PSP24185.1 MAG: transposase [Cyanobacteria bacterium SW_8_48_13]PSP35464.1 MAG: transposase [Cyanobacteria bacterium QS_8_48_54]